MEKTNSFDREISLSETFVFIFKIRNIIIISMIFFAIITSIKWFFFSKYNSISLPITIQNNKNYPINNYPINIEPSILAALYNYVFSSDKYSKKLYNLIISKNVDLEEKRNTFIILQNKLNNTSPLYFFSDGVTYEIDLRLKSTKKIFTNLELKNIEISINEVINQYNNDAYIELNEKIKVLSQIYNHKISDYFKINESKLIKFIEYKNYLNSNISYILSKIPLNKKKELDNTLDKINKYKSEQKNQFNSIDSLTKLNLDSINPNKLFELSFLLNNIIEFSKNNNIISDEKFNLLSEKIRKINKEILEFNEEANLSLTDISFSYNALLEAQKKFYNNSFLPNLRIENSNTDNIVRLNHDKYEFLKNILFDFSIGTFICINIALIINFLKNKYSIKINKFLLKIKHKK